MSVENEGLHGQESCKISCVDYFASLYEVVKVVTSSLSFFEPLCTSLTALISTSPSVSIL